MDELKRHSISIHEIYRASKVVSKYLKPTPLVRYESLSQLIGCNAYVKHENQNLTGSFKIRGGINLMSHVKTMDAKGVVTFSTGNHGLSIAASSKLFGIPSIVVVPKNSNPRKIKLIREAGAEVVEAGKNFDEAAEVVSEISKNKGYYFAHPADEPHVINGVGTEFIEIIHELPDIDAIILPLGGGSEVASAAVFLKSINPDIDIYAVQAQRSPAAYESWKRKEVVCCSNETFAGGFATGTAYQTTFNLYKNQLKDFILVEEEEILTGIALAAYHTRSLVEGAGAATIMAALKIPEDLKGKNVVLQFSGANASPQEIRDAYSLSALDTGNAC